MDDFDIVRIHATSALLDILERLCAEDKEKKINADDAEMYNNVLDSLVSLLKVIPADSSWKVRFFVASSMQRVCKIKDPAVYTLALV